MESMPAWGGTRHRGWGKTQGVDQDTGSRVRCRGWGRACGWGRTQGVGQDMERGD